MCELHLSGPKLEHITGRSGQSAQQGGGARSVRTGRRQNSRTRRQAVLVPSKASWTQCLNDSPAARTVEIPCKPNAGTKSAVDKQFAIGVSLGGEKLFLPTCPLVDRCSFFVNPFHASLVRELPSGCSRKKQFCSFGTRLSIAVHRTF